MSLLTNNLWHHRRLHLAVALGVAAATAVLAGALLVGDSMQGSLRQLTLERLGRVDEVLITPRFFRTELAHELQQSPDFQQHFAAAVPAIFVPGTLEKPAKKPARAAGVSIYGTPAEFWQLGEHGPLTPPRSGEIVLNEATAAELHITADDLVQAQRTERPLEILLRVGQSSQIPADSPLGRKSETVRSRRLIVTRIVPTAGLGRFGLRPTQQLPLNAWVSLDTLQDMLDQPDKANAILVAGPTAERMPSAAAHDWLAKSLHPQLADYGLRVQRAKLGYVNITSDTMVIAPELAQAVAELRQSLRVEPAFVYLSNYILAGVPDDAYGTGKFPNPVTAAAAARGKIPYSTVAGITLMPHSPLSAFESPNGESQVPLAADEIVLNRWAADDFKSQGVDLKPGDSIALIYFEPESTHGKIVERVAKFKLARIVEMTGPAIDPDFTPELKGVTDEESIANWNPPFPYDSNRVRSTPPKDQDDQYWKKYKATPKAFISLAKAHELWSSRFGDVTSYRIPDSQIEPEAVAAKIHIDPVTAGFEFLPVKRLGLLAASGTTPFGLLFLGFSLFIMAAAVMLIVLLFRLGVERRAKEIGLLAAIGWSRRRIRGTLLAEGFCVSAVGAAIGVGLGIGYAWLMLVGLRTWWLGAVSTPFLQLYVPPMTLLIGYVAGVAVAMLTIAWALRRLRRTSVRSLLAGQTETIAPVVGQRRRWVRWLVPLCLACAVALGIAAANWGGEAQAGAFFSAGSLVLIAALVSIGTRLRRPNPGALIAAGAAPLARLAFRNGARHPGRSTLSIGLVAAASFLIVSISAFRLDPPSAGPVKSSGNGGFAILGQTDQPVFHNPDTRAGREALSFDDDQAELMSDQRTYSLRVQPGDDASCLNLYQPRQPRWLGISDVVMERGGFEFSASAATGVDEQKNPWRLLTKQLPQRDGQAVVPTILDENTALYSLHLGSFVDSPVGKQFSVDNGRGGKIWLQVVGLLKNSIFQGDLLVSEENFLRQFPTVSGYRMFLVEVHGDEHVTQDVAETLEAALGDYGFDAEFTSKRLADLMLVQNTYLSTFQSLGGLGLLLGTFGLATVQLRNVWERRGELALFRAVGFRRSRLATLVLLENASLLLAGLCAGVAAAIVAVLPHVLRGGAGLPWQSLAVTLAIVLVAGLLAGLGAVLATLRAPLVPALREE